MINIKGTSGFTFIAEGGEGSIYDYSKDKVIKIYKDHIDLNAKERKLKILMSKNLPREVIAPTDLVYRNNKFVGYIMDRVAGNDFYKLSSKKFLKSNKVTTKDILGMIIKIQNVLDTLHSQNIFIGDLNDQNILFDDNFNIYFIDCDSWSVENEHCLVVMDQFKDPLMKRNSTEFNADTDTYAFSIMCWRALTRIHPYGGKMDPDLDLLERMRQGISVLEEDKVSVPRTTKSWKNLSPQLVDILHKVFQNKLRKVGDEFVDMFNNLKFCDKDKEYYYGKYITCPLCDSNAQVIIKPQSKGVVSGIALVAQLSADRVSVVLNFDTYIDKNNNVVDTRSGKSVQFKKGTRYYFLDNGFMVEDEVDTIIIHGNQTGYIKKRYNTNIVVSGNRIYYLLQSSLTCAEVTAIGNGISKVTSCDSTAYFEVAGDNYCVLNVYDNNIIVEHDNCFTQIKHTDGVINYGIHHDFVTGKWLVVIEGRSGKFRTIVISGKDVELDIYDIKYQCSLGNLCFHADTIFIPIDGFIRGYAYKKNVYKNFECPVVDNDSKLQRRDKKFAIINDDNTYLFG